MTRNKAYNVFAVIVALTPVIMAFVVALGIFLAKPALPRDLGQWEATSADVREWYQNLKRPDSPKESCCGEADAYWADSFEVKDGKTIAIITDTRDDIDLNRPHITPGTRIEVPNVKMKYDKGNPTGHGVIFVKWDTDDGEEGSWNVLCYVTPGGA